MAATKPDLSAPPLTEAQVDAYLKALSPAGLEVLVDFYRRMKQFAAAREKQEQQDGSSES